MYVFLVCALTIGVTALVVYLLCIVRYPWKGKKEEVTGLSSFV